jgi:hypothetical protein
MKSLPVILVSNEVPLCGEAPTVINSNCPIKVGEKDELGLSRHVREAVGSHLDCLFTRAKELRVEKIQKNQVFKNCPSIGENWGWVERYRSGLVSIQQKIFLDISSFELVIPWSIKMSRLRQALQRVLGVTPSGPLRPRTIDTNFSILKGD